MKSITLEELLEAGCHFGHQVTRQNPKAREFVFEARDNIHIIDLAKTKEGLEEGALFLENLAKQPDATLLVVGTKRQAVPILEETLKSLSEKQQNLDIFTVTKRWIGGTLTNLAAVGRNFARLRELNTSLHSDEWEQKYTKRELLLFEREKQKLEDFYGGIAEMKKLPSALLVIDTHTEELAVKEARRMGIPVVGIVDTNADPDFVDYVIPANDDAVGSLKLIIGFVLDAWSEGKSKGTKETDETKETKAELKKEAREPAEAPVIASEAKQSPKEDIKVEEPKKAKSSKKKE